MKTVVNRKGLRDTVLFVLIGEIPTLPLLDQRQPVRTITVHLVGGHVNERGLGTMLAASFEEVEGAPCVNIEIIKRNRRGQVVRRLRSGVNYEFRFNDFD